MASVALELPGPRRMRAETFVLWSCRGPCQAPQRISLEDSLALRLLGPSPHHGWGLRCFQGPGATAASWRGLFSSWGAGSLTP